MRILIEGNLRNYEINLLSLIGFIICKIGASGRFCYDERIAMAVLICYSVFRTNEQERDMFGQRYVDFKGKFDLIPGLKLLGAYVHPPFALVRYARDVREVRLFLRLDLDKRCFVETDAEEAVSDGESYSLSDKSRLLERAPEIAEFISTSLAREEPIQDRIIQLVRNRSDHEDAIREINLELEARLRELKE